MTAAERPMLMSIDQVSERLGRSARELAQKLFPNGREHGGSWWIGGLDGQPSRHAHSLVSLRVQLSGAHAGSWKDFATGEAGDALDLVAEVLFRRDKREALKWSSAWLGLSGLDPAAMATERRQQAERNEAAEQAEARETERLRRLAHRRWLEAQERIAGTPVESYLAGRGIDLASLGRQPGAIRFHPTLYCEEVQAHLPAMVTAISGPSGFLACHRTWLEQAGPGDWRKARLAAPKKVLGRFGGGVISLWRGASRRALPAAMPGEIVDVTEGIEDGLSVAMADADARVIAAVSLSNMGMMHLPDAIKGVRLWRQNDTKPAAIAAADRVLQQLLTRGLDVFVVQIPPDVKDVNEWLTKGGVAA